MTIEEEIKQKKFISIYQKAVLNLIYTANWLVGKQHLFFKPYGITGQQFNVLRILKGQHTKAISAKEIKSRMLDKNSDISRLLDRLLKKNLIQKQNCENDRRASDILITTEGIELLKRISKQQTNLDHILLLSNEEAEQLSILLDKSRG